MTEPQEGTGHTTAVPFLGALAIIVAIVIGIWLFNAFSDPTPNDGEQIADAVAGQNDALQRGDYADFRGFTCGPQAGTEAQFAARQHDSVAKRGQRFVDGVSNVKVDGDRATGSVTYHFDSAPGAKQTVDVGFAREGGAWKVCSTGPS